MTIRVVLGLIDGGPAAEAAARAALAVADSLALICNSCMSVPIPRASCP